MADVLVDTSVWIDFFQNDQGPVGDFLDSLLAEDRVALCGIVEMEIFQGLRKNELAGMESVFKLIPYLETKREDFITAGTLWNRLRQRGVTIPSTDCLIAVLCMRHNLSLFSLDAHFDAIKNLKHIKP